ncbi:sensor histidine kinase [Rhodobacter maris]|uniref:histidine kinase n=1 Tax=Rhodobacter maris TaxID=446682 RepID=A0A285SNU9_9RHOB|nr:sensor histidine kinase [Rhodobacter maris]SOC09161.1 Cache sensor signal transduction histidine kinase [Rhodobacter maris]
MIGKRRKTAAPVPLKTWLWHAYLRAAMLPLLLIELGFLVIYWGTSQLVYDRSASALSQISTQTLHEAAIREANVIAHRLDSVTALTRVLAAETGRALATPARPSMAERSRYETTPEGALVSRSDDGGAAVFYSAITKIGPAEREKLWRTATLDPLLRAVTEAEPLITQTYLNTDDSLNRIHPWFDVRAIYPPRMDIPSYNFYYEADAAHDPSRGPVWTDAYVDPAGGGWMVSSIAPVYGARDRLAAVVGADVTVATIIARVLDITLPGAGYAVLVGRDGTVLALPPAAEADLGMTELVGHDYESAILADTFKPEEFNIFARADLSDLAQRMQETPEGVGRLTRNRPMLAAWATVAGPNWQLLVLTSEAAVLSDSAALSHRLAFVGKGMLAILVLFYAGFFALLWRRSSRMSARVARPLDDLEGRMAVIAEGGTLSAPARTEILELQRVSEHLVTMADRLDAANRAKAQFLSAMSHELRTPLTAIIGYADLLEGSAGKELDGARIEQVRAISRAGWTLVRLVDMVLDLSRLERQDMRMARERVAIVPLIEDAFESLRPEAERLALELSIEPRDAPLPTVLCDGEALRRILDQLLSNAIKYNVEGGSVRISFRQEDPDELAVRVTDSGPGIAPEHHATIFEAFERLGHENGTIGGAGIGLSLARRFAEMAGCGLSFESAPGKGATFVLRVPVARPERPLQ